LAQIEENYSKTRIPLERIIHPAWKRQVIHSAAMAPPTAARFPLPETSKAL
jgi:hypothetical protein